MTEPQKLIPHLHPDVLVLFPQAFLNFLFSFPARYAALYCCCRSGKQPGEDVSRLSAALVLYIYVVFSFRHFTCSTQTKLILTKNKKITCG